MSKLRLVPIYMWRHKDPALLFPGRAGEALKSSRALNIHESCSWLAREVNHV